MRARSARCSHAGVAFLAVNSRALVAALLSGAALLGSWSPLLAQSLWLSIAPQGDGEAALRDSLAASGFEAPAARASALRQLSEAQPGSVASGLAQLAAGLLLLDGGKPAEAVAALRHPDVARSAAPERALLALGRALDQTKDTAGAAQAYLAAADARREPPTLCEALFGAADVLQRASHFERALEVLAQADGACEEQRARALLATASAHDAKRDLRSAALAYDRLDRDYPASAAAREGRPRLAQLAAYLPEVPQAERDARSMSKGLALFEAGRHAEAAAALRQVAAGRLSSGEADLVRARLGRAFLALGQRREAELALSAIRPGSAYEAEAAFHLARIQELRTGKRDGFESVAARFAGSEWAEEALLRLANSFQKDARDEEALPYYRRLLDGYPEGRYYERATWRVGWGDYRAGRYEQAATEMERTARLRPRANVTPGLLYWSGRARRELGQLEHARALFEETYRRYKHAYHGIRAREALAQLPPGPYTPPPPAEPREPGTIPAAARERVRQLALIERFEEAQQELRTVPASPFVEATIAWLDSKRGRLRPAITGMKRAYPDYIGERDAALPDEAWRILYPLEFGDVLRAKAVEEGLDPALVAALVCQESTFDPGAVSSAGARGLMQIMPPTGRALARALGVTYNRALLHKPEPNLDFGTRYLREMLDRFGGRVERGIAAYNAGPHRVAAWTAGREEMTAEEFVESIPFTETRLYVMTILATQEQYRRIYRLAAADSGGERGTD